MPSLTDLGVRRGGGLKETIDTEMDAAKVRISERFTLPGLDGPVDDIQSAASALRTTADDIQRRAGDLGDKAGDITERLAESVSLLGVLDGKLKTAADIIMSGGDVTLPDGSRVKSVATRIKSVATLIKGITAELLVVTKWMAANIGDQKLRDMLKEYVYNWDYAYNDPQAWFVNLSAVGGLIDTIGTDVGNIAAKIGMPSKAIRALGKATSWMSTVFSGKLEFPYNVPIGLKTKDWDIRFPGYDIPYTSYDIPPVFIMTIPVPSGFKTIRPNIGLGFITDNVPIPRLFLAGGMLVSLMLKMLLVLRHLAYIMELVRDGFGAAREAFEAVRDAFGAFKDALQAVRALVSNIRDRFSDMRDGFELMNQMGGLIGTGFGSVRQFGFKTGQAFDRIRSAIRIDMKAAFVGTGKSDGAIDDIKRTFMAVASQMSRPLGLRGSSGGPGAETGPEGPPLYSYRPGRGTGRAY